MFAHDKFSEISLWQLELGGRGDVLYSFLQLDINKVMEKKTR